MKKTLNINLAGYPFTIDEDAYKLLKDYLDTIRYAFETSEDTNELATDIETRIAEILLEKENGAFRIVTFEEISKVIERIGKPSEFIELEENLKTVSSVYEGSESGVAANADSSEQQEIKIEEEFTPPPYSSPQPHYSRNPFARKKIFRDPQDAMLGGVCSGLAAYLHIDVTIVRLITVVLFFLSASTVAIIYIILWIVVPAAYSPIQQMQMRGEDPTVENIGKRVTEAMQQEEDPYSRYQTPGNKRFLEKCMAVFVKCLIILGCIIAFPILIVLAAALIGCMIAIFVIGIGLFTGTIFDNFNEGLMVLYILLAVIGGAITLGLPIWLLIRMLWKKDETNPNPSTRRSMLIIWLCGIALLAVFTVKAVKKSRQLDRESRLYWEQFTNSDTQTEPGEIIIESDLEEIADTINTTTLRVDSTGIMIKKDNGKTIKISDDEVVIENENSLKEIQTQPNQTPESENQKANPNPHKKIRDSGEEASTLLK